MNFPKKSTISNIGLYATIIRFVGVLLTLIIVSFMISVAVGFIMLFISISFTGLLVYTF